MIPALDSDSIYKIPMMLHEQMLDEIVCHKLQILASIAFHTTDALTLCRVANLDPDDARDVDADNVFCNPSYFRPAHAVLQNAGDARTTVEEPHCARGVKPEFVAPPPTEE